MGDSAVSAADRALAGLGYKAELPRNLSMLSILGMSFAIMAVPFAIAATMSITLTNGQSVTVVWGWVLVSLVSVCIAASLAEICAVFPTAGGVYHWSAMLSSRRWAPLVSFIDGWLTLVGNWTVTLAIGFSGSQMILSAVTLFHPSYVTAPWHVLLVYWAFMLACALVNAFASRYLDLINKLCMYWTAATSLVILVTLLAMAPASVRRDAAFVFTHYDASASGWPAGWSFFVGLLQPAYVLTGYGMVPAMCEEVRNPEREVPRGMVLSVLVGSLAGIAFILPVLFVLPDVAMLLQAADSQPIAPLFKVITGSAASSFGLLFLLLGVLLFAGVGALTASSRCTYAFARDGAIPGYKIWGRVNARLSVPLWALGLSTVVDCLLACIYLGSAAAFNSFTGIATLCLSCSYVVPVIVNLARRRRLVRNSPYPLGRFGPVINIICVAWIALALVIFCVPIALPVTPSSMNYASVVFTFFASVAFVWYFVYARKNFKGPPVHVDGPDDPLPPTLKDPDSGANEASVEGKLA